MRVNNFMMRFMMRMSKACNCPAVGARTAWITGTPSVERYTPSANLAMQMDVEIGGRAETLDEGDSASIGLDTLWPRLLDQKSGNDPVDDLQDRCEQFRMCSEQEAQRDRKREHPLPYRHPGDDVINKVRGRLHHAPGATAGAENHAACN